MPTQFQLNATDFVWVKTESPYGTLQFKDVSGDEYYAATKVYRIAFIGRGSAIAYYLTALAPRTTVVDESDTVALHKSMVVFGKIDPWSKDVRGEGYLNHEEHLVGHWGTEVAKYSKDYMRRSAFVVQNAAAFNKAVELGAELADLDVHSVHRRGDIYQIFTKDSTSYWAAFVVTALGLGPHRGLGAGRGAPSLDPSVTSTLLTTQRAQDALAPSVMDLDRFMREFPEHDGIDKDTRKRLTPDEKLTIGVLGPNAAIDAVQRAWQLGHKIVWLYAKAPIFLKGNRLPIDDDSCVDVERHVITSDPTVCPAENEKVTLKWKEATGNKTTDVDVFVIAVGQDPFAEGAVGDVLFQKGNIPKDGLRMLWDFDQVFGLPFQTILGYQVPGRRRGFGLQIIGGACESLARELSKIYDEAKLYQDFDEQLTPLGDKPTEQTSDEQIEASPSLKKKWGLNRKKFHEQRLENWQRATADRERFKLLAKDYIAGMKKEPASALLMLLIHQVDPSAVPARLSDILNGFKKDHFLVGQAATEQRPGTSGGASALLPSQLSAVRAVVAALNAFIPEYVLQGDANFTTDDRNMLAVYIALNFPGFSASEADARVAATMSLRRSDTSPLGFHNDELRATIQKRWGQESGQ